MRVDVGLVIESVYGPLFLVVSLQSSVPLQKDLNCPLQSEGTQTMNIYFSPTPAHAMVINKALCCCTDHGKYNILGVNSGPGHQHSIRSLLIILTSTRVQEAATGSLPIF